MNYRLLFLPLLLTVGCMDASNAGRVPAVPASDAAVRHTLNIPAGTSPTDLSGKDRQTFAAAFGTLSRAARETSRPLKDRDADVRHVLEATHAGHPSILAFRQMAGNAMLPQLLALPPSEERDRSIAYYTTHMLDAGSVEIELVGQALAALDRLWPASQLNQANRQLHDNALAYVTTRATCEDADCTTARARYRGMQKNVDEVTSALAEFQNR